ncbi:MAG TPA: SUMF1/EgtB/PvdO family nonheme iron enzyme [Phycisphaerae bacterium]|nr:SUMF1/EgtB/PvdO family nonheme iron enzyme [Phycisphaerae bacterium]HRY70694.1 SUMF1/EgtB/PvdO family nonheme iron enzyme [Phycisphaerae bacterium]HSA28711.1 SUMF1/EgtB/PvdO family nonheme iron enzyme [Phycisphaerae bacterium]
MTALKAMVSVCVVTGLLVGTAFAVNIETVPVGNPGSAADIRYRLDQRPEGFGRVDYTYNIGKYEVTAAQYTAFLNAVAVTDPYGLYNTNMWTSTHGCKIQRSGTPGNYTYSVASDYADRPVNLVSWGDSARFANWLHNGQPTGAQGSGTTETGAYALNGALTNTDLQAVSRNADWKWAIPSEDEWYKAAYHKNDGVTGNYWDYPTGSDTIPSHTVLNPDPGNNANFFEYESGYPVYSIGSPYWRTQVGEFENSGSPYGTFDQGGNVDEWNEAVLSDSLRGVRGGAYTGRHFDLHPLNRFWSYQSTQEFTSIGFRVVAVPEPAVMALLAFGGIGMLIRRRRLEK